MASSKEANWNLNSDLKTVTLTLLTDPPVTMIFDLTAVEDLLKGLGTIRASMKPEVSPQFPMGQKVEAVPDPAWMTEPDLMGGDSLFHIRDPRYG